MDHRNPDTIPDGGHPERTGDPNNQPEDDSFDLDVDLPEDSIFDLEDYLNMYEVASRHKQFRILTALAKNNELSTSELSRELGLEDNRLHYPLRTLKDTALIRNRRDPNTGTEETYSYYELTDLGRIVLTEGIAEGVNILAQQEATLESKYS